MSSRHVSISLEVRNHLTRGTALRISSLSFLLLLGLILFLIGENRLVGMDEAIVVEANSLSGFEEIHKGVFRASNVQNEFHSLAMQLALVPNAYYRIRYDVPRLAREKVTVTADLYAPGYDNPEQELSKVFGMSVQGKRQDFIINSGKSPEHALFRLFYSGPPGLEIANLHITRVAAWRIWLKWGLFAGAFSALLIIVMFVIQHFRNLTALSQPTEVGTPRIMADEALALVAVYLCAVLIRYIMYIVMPYWSGDEYAYKSIAAGIWHFGKNGVLTDTMVAQSVDLPNLLYPYLISPAFMLGENFYFGVRLINAIVINLAIFPCYLIARKYLNRVPALAATSVSIAIPFANLGAYVVTEVLFFPLFLFSVWVAIESIDRPRSIGWVIAFGAVAAILLNVRLNAMVLLPAYFISLLWISLSQRQALSLLKRPYWFGVVIAFLGTDVLLQYILGTRKIGDIGLYAQVVERSEGPFSVFANDPVGIFHLIVGHLTTLAIPYALPIALMISAIASGRSKLISNRKFYDFLVVATIFSSALFVLALVFTISVSPFDLGGLGRWHSRYYFYFYPLVIIAGAVFAERLQPTATSDRLGVIVIVVLLLTADIYFIKLHGGLQNPWFGSIADNMDVQWYREAGIFYWLFIAFTLALAWLWYNRSAHFAGGLVCFIFIWVIVANYGTLRVAEAGPGAISDACGNLSQRFLDQYPGRFAIAGDSRATMVGAAFWNPYIPEKTLLHNDSSKSIGPAEVGVPADYLVVNGDIQVDAAYRSLVSIGKCAIYKLPN